MIVVAMGVVGAGKITAGRLRARLCVLVLIALSTRPPASASQKHFLKNYKGTPYQDSHYTEGAQEIPGKIECAYYDLGGEGIAYHDVDAKNNGSGGLNPADGTYLNQFRMDEGVDISYTKFHDQIDNSPYNIVQPPENQLYVGWTEPGEWFNLTVRVARAGFYGADLLYTSNRGGSISVDVNGEAATRPLIIESTYNVSDPTAWRQWHHWNVAHNLLKLHLAPGKNVLTIHILTGGNMNLAYFDFKLVD
jgi:carbohydrate binding protein with CBM6 domain